MHGTTPTPLLHRGRGRDEHHAGRPSPAYDPAAAQPPDPADRGKRRAGAVRARFAAAATDRSRADFLYAGQAPRRRSGRTRPAHAAPRATGRARRDWLRAVDAVRRAARRDPRVSRGGAAYRTV